jgi:hypothetical protein
MYSFPKEYLNHCLNTVITNKRESNMKTSESIKNLSKALLKAQSQMGSAKKDSKNPFFKSNYADLPTVMEVVKAPLNEAGIIVLQPATSSSYPEGVKNYITTTLIHAETGEWISSDTEVVCAKANDPQAFGAAQTYARRFGLQSMLFIPAEDDDGNYASGRTVKSSVASAQAVQETAKAETTTVAAESQAKVEPMKKSIFRKGKTVAESATTKVVSTVSSASTETASDEDWA